MKKIIRLLVVILAAGATLQAIVAFAKPEGILKKFSDSGQRGKKAGDPGP
ncbi:MAG: hypothetical protein AB7F59_12315 [Bdellovibrionales bacterium]